MVISGFGNVAWGTAMMLEKMGAKLIAFSGPDGYILDEEGIDKAGAFFKYNGETIVQCREAAKKYLKENAAVMEEIDATVREKAKTQAEASF